MKKTTTTLAALAMCLGVLSAQAQWTYFDVLDGLYAPDSPGQGGSGTPNTFNAGDDSAFTWSATTDTGVGWRTRNGGPGIPAYDPINNANYSAFSGFASGANGPDPALYTILSGLAANTQYKVRVYAVYANSVTNVNLGSRSRLGANFSYDGGATWDQISSRNTGVHPIQVVDNSSGVGADLANPLTSGDWRGYAQMDGWATSDAGGNIRIDLVLPTSLVMPDGTVVTQDRFHIDGYAVAVPEPTSFALAGLGTAALLIFRRRR